MNIAQFFPERRQGSRGFLSQIFLVGTFFHDVDGI
jgi:hypothetical protein